MDTGTRDIVLSKGDFVENFTYDKWQQIINAGRLDVANVIVPETGESENKLNESEEN